MVQYGILQTKAPNRVIDILLLVRSNHLIWKRNVHEGICSIQGRTADMRVVLAVSKPPSYPLSLSSRGALPIVMTPTSKASHSLYNSDNVL